MSVSALACCISVFCLSLCLVYNIYCACDLLCRPAGGRHDAFLTAEVFVSAEGGATVAHIRSLTSLENTLPRPLCVRVCVYPSAAPVAVGETSPVIVTPGMMGDVELQPITARPLTTHEYVLMPSQVSTCVCACKPLSLFLQPCCVGRWFVRPTGYFVSLL